MKVRIENRGASAGKKGDGNGGRGGELGRRRINQHGSAVSMNGYFLVSTEVHLGAFAGSCAKRKVCGFIGRETKIDRVLTFAHWPRFERLTQRNCDEMV